jgi:hypothetical protein
MHIFVHFSYSWSALSGVFRFRRFVVVLLFLEKLAADSVTRANMV